MTYSSDVTNIKLNFEAYKDKVNACWVGKNIGGTMGAPYEGTHEALDISGFITKKGEVLPNDDLDLQLIWLMALEQIGPHAINAATLGEYWLSFITPHWNEYGISKLNMRRGLIPPLAGDYLNTWKDSNGAWIRTEIWACTAPANPNLAARFAIEDAKVDHGAGEGTTAAAFVAAMQSAAFVFSDIRDCIAVGLAAIPENSRIASSVRFVLDAYERKMSPRETREAILKLNADIGDGWFEAPSNVAYVVLGLMYGEGDFKQSMIHAINCGDDTDCTAATVGATLGILGGMKAIPTDWQEHIGDDIVTVSIARGNNGKFVPKTCTKLTERVVDMAPVVLASDCRYDNIQITDADAFVPENALEQLKIKVWFIKKDLEKLKPYTITSKNVLFNTELVLNKAPDIAPGETIEIDVGMYNNRRPEEHENAPLNISFRWWLPDGFSVEGKQTMLLPHCTPHTKNSYANAHFVIRAGETVSASNRLVLEIIADGRHTATYIPIVLLG